MIVVAVEHWIVDQLDLVLALVVLGDLLLSYFSLPEWWRIWTLDIVHESAH